jgi:hypothetical protein
MPSSIAGGSRCFILPEVLTRTTFLFEYRDEIFREIAAIPEEAEFFPHIGTARRTVTDKVLLRVPIRHPKARCKSTTLRLSAGARWNSEKLGGSQGAEP